MDAPGPRSVRARPPILRARPAISSARIVTHSRMCLSLSCTRARARFALAAARRRVSRSAATSWARRASACSCSARARARAASRSRSNASQPPPNWTAVPVCRSSSTISSTTSARKARSWETSTMPPGRERIRAGEVRQTVIVEMVRRFIEQDDIEAGDREPARDRPARAARRRASGVSGRATCSPRPNSAVAAASRASRSAPPRASQRSSAAACASIAARSPSASRVAWRSSSRAALRHARPLVNQLTYRDAERLMVPITCGR